MMSSSWRRLACRFRGGHDDAVAAVLVDTAILGCDRCGRCKLAPYRVAAPPTMAESAAWMEVALVDKGALDLLQWSAAIGAHLANALDRGDLS